MMAGPNWYVITGAPSAGKSTVIDQLAERGYNTAPEMGRQLIDEQLSQGKSLGDINVDSPEFELAWVRLQAAQEAQLKPQTLTFLDRGILDTLAYFQYYNWPVPRQITDRCQAADYKGVFLLEMLDYEQDYARVEGAETAHAMQKLFGQVYQAAGFKVVTIPKAPVLERLDMILSHL